MRKRPVLCPFLAQTWLGKIPPVAKREAGLLCAERAPMYSGKMTGDAAYESEPEVEDDSYVDASQPSAPAAKVNIVPTKGAMRFKRHSARPD